MRVALCYNKKPQQDTETRDNDDSEPPPSNDHFEKYAEFDDDHTINAISTALSRLHEVYLVEADKNAYNKFIDLKPDIVFNIAEGLKGPYRESIIPSILEFLQIPYTGSDPLTLSICLDKALTKQILKFHSVPTPEFQLVSSIEDTAVSAKVWDLYPCIVKPVHEGSSIGVWNESVIESPNQLLNQLEKTITCYGQPAIIERMLFGREFTVGILGNCCQEEILSLIEICFNTLPEDAKPIYSYEAKWIWDNPDQPLKIFKCPAQIDEKLLTKIRETALTAYRVLRCRDWARIDLRLDEYNEPNVLEVNPLPGILPNPDDNSCMPKAARAAGLEYDDLILKVLNIACERYGIKN